MAARKTTSVKVDPELWKEFKKHAIDQDKDISSMLEEIIKRELKM
jgi:hypothetical protein